MHRKVLFFLSLICVIFLVIQIAGLLNQDFDLNREDKTKASINIWTTTPRLSYILQRYESQSNVQINFKQFHDTESLLGELELASTEDSLPDLIEMDNHLELDYLLNQYNPISLDKLAPDMPGLFHQSITNNFISDSALFAYPLGIEMPLLLTNQSILGNFPNMIIYPFRNEAILQTYHDVQESMNENNSGKQFWFFHFDENIPWYWSSYQQSMDAKVEDFETVWKDLTDTYELVPSLDHHMALTRFVNMEVAALVTSSNNLQTLQQSIGNDFEFEAAPFMFNKSDEIPVYGHGLVAFSENPEIKDLFTFLNEEEVQQDLLGETGWLPSQEQLLESGVFIQRLPMSKYLSELTSYRNQFIGVNPEKDEIEEWNGIRRKVQEIEME